MQSYARILRDVALLTVEACGTWMAPPMTRDVIGESRLNASLAFRRAQLHLSISVTRASRMVFVSSSTYLF